MNLARATLSSAEKLFDRALCVAGAVLFSQAPEFMQQYLQRLGGHLDEARRQLAQFTRVAADSGLSFQEFIAKTQANTDMAVARLGGVMGDIEARVETLADAQAAILGASPLTRPFVFLRHVDSEIAHATWSIYQPAVPTTVEGLLYALLGMALLLLLYHGLIKAPVARIFNPRKSARARQIA
jgi:hypothetical protein